MRAASSTSDDRPRGRRCRTDGTDGYVHPDCDSSLQLGNGGT